MVDVHGDRLLAEELGLCAACGRELAGCLSLRLRLEFLAPDAIASSAPGSCRFEQVAAAAAALTSRGMLVGEATICTREVATVCADCMLSPGDLATKFLGEDRDERASLTRLARMLLEEPT